MGRITKKHHSFARVLLSYQNGCLKKAHLFYGLSALDTVLATFLMVVTEMPDKRQLKEGRFCFSLQFKGTAVHHAGWGALRQEHEALCTTVRKQKMTAAGA